LEHPEGAFYLWEMAFSLAMVSPNYPMKSAPSMTVFAKKHSLFSEIEKLQVDGSHENA
jgi:hypothetical protein